MIQELEMTTLSHYRLTQLLAYGGMSVVYKAEDSVTGQPVAIKLVHRSDTGSYERFQREVKLLAGLKHAHILPMIEAGESGSWFYMVMPYVAHGTLKQRIEQRRLSAHEASEIMMQLTGTLHYLHTQGIVHGDVKSSNILLGEGMHCYLADFGLAHYAGESDDTIQLKRLQGTPEYMAPELASQPATRQSDVYALGIVLYQMLTGQSPFKSTTAIGHYWRHRYEQPLAPSYYNATLSSAIDAVVLKALAKEPTQRFASMHAFALAYRAATHKQAFFASHVHVGTPVVATVLSVCVISTLLGFSFSYFTDHPWGASALNQGIKVSAHAPSTFPMPPQQVHRVAVTTKVPPQRLLAASTLIISTTSATSKTPTKGTGTGTNSGQRHRKKRHKGGSDYEIDALVL